MAPATAKYHLWFRAECRGPCGERRSFQTFLLGRELFMRVVYPGLIFCSVISFLCTWLEKQWAMKLQELKIKFDVNTHATWSSIENFPNWHELRHHASVRRRRGDGEGSGSQVAAMMLESWECGWSGEGEGPRGTCQLIIIHYSQGSGVRWGDKWHSQTRGEVARLDNGPQWFSRGQKIEIFGECKYGIMISVVSSFICHHEHKRHLPSI